MMFSVIAFTIARKGGQEKKNLNVHGGKEVVKSILIYLYAQKTLEGERREHSKYL